MKKVTPGSATLSVVLVLTLIWVAHWLGFNADQIMTILGGAMMLAGMLTHMEARKGPHWRLPKQKGGGPPVGSSGPPVSDSDEGQPAGKSEP